MITVKLFGLVRLETGIKELQIEAVTIKSLKKELTRHIPEEKIKGCVLLVNGRQANRFTKLQDGDHLIFSRRRVASVGMPFLSQPRAA